MSVYLITGAAGYIGSMLVRHLLEHDRDSQVIALVRDLKKAKERLNFLCCSLDSGGLVSSSPDSCNPAHGIHRLDRSRLTFFRTDLCDGFWPDRFCAEYPGIDYIIHCASVTGSSEMVSHPVKVIQSIVNGTQNVLEAARRCGIKSMVYLSSMEVYGTIDCADGRRVTEEEAAWGRVEPLCARSCYPVGKRMAENLCYSYVKEYGVPVKIARLAQTFGQGVLSSDNRVFAQFARAVKEGRDLVLHTEGTSVGNYCGIGDAVEGILTILKRGQDGEAYNVVNEENTMTIREMAAMVAERIGEGRIKVTYEISQDNQHGYAADTGLRLSGEKLKGLGWQAKTSLEEMYRELLKDLQAGE